MTISRIETLKTSLEEVSNKREQYLKSIASITDHHSNTVNQIEAGITRWESEIVKCKSALAVISSLKTEHGVTTLRNDPTSEFLRKMNIAKTNIAALNMAKTYAVHLTNEQVISFQAALEDCHRNIVILTSEIEHAEKNKETNEIESSEVIQKRVFATLAKAGITAPFSQTVPVMPVLLAASTTVRAAMSVNAAVVATAVDATPVVATVVATRA